MKKNASFVHYTKLIPPHGKLLALTFLDPGGTYNSRVTGALARIGHSHLQSIRHVCSSTDHQVDESQSDIIDRMDRFKNIIERLSATVEGKASEAIKGRVQRPIDSQTTTVRTPAKRTATSDAKKTPRKRQKTTGPAQEPVSQDKSRINAEQQELRPKKTAKKTATKKAQINVPASQKSATRTPATQKPVVVVEANLVKLESAEPITQTPGSADTSRQKPTTKKHSINKCSNTTTQSSASQTPDQDAETFKKSREFIKSLLK